MSMNRRNVLIGLGAVAAGGGAVLGSGAFSQAEAERTVTINSSGDSTALLQLGQGSGATGIVSTESSSGGGNAILTINQGNLNEDAQTRWNDAIEVANNSGQSFDFYITGTGVGDGNTLDFEDSADTNADGNTTVVDSANATTIGSSDTIQLDVVVDLTGTKSTSDIGSPVTFWAV